MMDALKARRIAPGQANELFALLDEFRLLEASFADGDPADAQHDNQLRDEITRWLESGGDVAHFQFHHPAALAVCTRFERALAAVKAYAEEATAALRAVLAAANREFEDRGDRLIAFGDGAKLGEIRRLCGAVLAQRPLEMGAYPEQGATTQWQCASGHTWSAPRFRNGGSCPQCGTGAIGFARAKGSPDSHNEAATHQVLPPEQQGEYDRARAIEDALRAAVREFRRLVGEKAAYSGGFNILLAERLLESPDSASAVEPRRPRP
jgi:hypothetical protein